MPESPLKFAHFPFIEKILLREKQHLSRPLLIFDVACGPGELTRYCRIPDGCNLFGLDLWEYQLRQAAERNIYAALCQMNLVEGLPFKENSVDVIILGEILMYLPNSYKLLKD